MKKLTCIKDGGLHAHLTMGNTYEILAQFHGLVLLHSHCHQKALNGSESTMKVLAALPGVESAEVDSGDINLGNVAVIFSGLIYS